MSLLAIARRRLASAAATLATPPRPAVALYLCERPVDYLPCWEWQKEQLEERVRRKQGHDSLVILEHTPVYTIGRSGKPHHVKFEPSSSRIPLHLVNRGGDVTYHGPGQLVGYPLLDLRNFRPDLHWYVRQLEETIIRTLAVWNLCGERNAEHTGVWVGGAKVAAIGINASRWITMHGFSLNVDVDMAPFRDIVPCGIADKPVVSMTELLGAAPPRHEVRDRLLESFAHVFGVALVRASPPRFCA
jgi:lipoyl(octanoyl) transferase